MSFDNDATVMDSPSKKMRVSHEGGSVFASSDIAVLRRFMCLGVEGGSYYVTQKGLDLSRVACLERLVAADDATALEAVAEIRRFSVEGRTAKQDTIVGALAYLAHRGSVPVRQAALMAMPDVCRTPTMLFAFVQAGEKASKDAHTGWGRAQKRAVGRWYNGKTAGSLLYAMTKYAQRDGWTHADVLRLAHVNPSSPLHGLLYKGATKGWDVVRTELTERASASSAASDAEASGASPAPSWTSVGRSSPTWLLLDGDGDEQMSVEARVAKCKSPREDEAPDVLRQRDEASALAYLGALSVVSTTKEEREVLAAIRRHRLPREVIPSQWLGSREVWLALLEAMPMTAMLRNLAKMTTVGALRAGKPLPVVDGADTSDDEAAGASVAAVANVCSVLSSPVAVRSARLHPFNVLNASQVYRRGCGDKGKLSWEPVPEILTALEAAFYNSFVNVQPTGKRILLALDVSGSMSGAQVLGSSMTVSAASAALAMVTARCEPHHQIMCFSHKFVPLDIDASMDLGQVNRAVTGLPFGGTDCSLPMLYAMEHQLPVDVFIVITDNETFHREMTPAAALRKYRAMPGMPEDAKLIVIAMSVTEFSIADPEDKGMLDMAGFDASGPEIMRQFMMGEI